MFFGIVFLVMFILADCAFGSSNVCQENHVACRSENTFSLCVEGKPTEYVVRCPEDRICSNEAAICVRKTGNVTKTSYGTNCRVCGSNGKVFSCVGKKEFVFCFGENEPFLEAGGGSCLDGYVCDLNRDDICGSEIDSMPSCMNDKPDDSEGSKNKADSSQDRQAETSAGDERISVIKVDQSKTQQKDGDTQISEKASDRTSDITPKQNLPSIDFSTNKISTPNKSPRDVSTFCSEVRQIGTFRAEGDTTCKRYYICTTYKCSFKGYEYNCGVNNYFNSETRLCQREKPDNC